MMKHKSVFFIAVAMMLVPGVNGVWGATALEPSASRVKCVNLKSTTSCTAATITNYSRDWSAACGSATVRGISACGYISTTDAFDPPAVGTTATSVTFNKDSGVGMHVMCWCRMTIPALSPWVSAGMLESIEEDDCHKTCAQKCSTATTTQAFRAGLFGNMS